MKIKFKKMHPLASMPKKAHRTDAGFDLYCCDFAIDWAKQELVCRTGIAVEIPEGYAGLIFPRSSVSNKPLLLHNSVGVVDSGYTGEITAKFIITDLRAYLQNDDNKYQVGDRIAQMVILPYPEIEFEEVDELAASERGAGGYGSTGK